MKHLKLFEDQYLTDQEIEDSYKDWTISDEFKMHSNHSGDIILERPYDEDCDECETEKLDNFIIYNTGKVAFDHWYPEFLYIKMVKFIYNKLPKHNPMKQKVGDYIIKTFVFR